MCPLSLGNSVLQAALVVLDHFGRPRLLIPFVGNGVHLVVAPLDGATPPDAFARGHFLQLLCRRVAQCGPLHEWLLSGFGKIKVIKHLFGHVLLHAVFD